jgi:hypothetical protein
MCATALAVIKSKYSFCFESSALIFFILIFKFNSFFTFSKNFVFFLIGSKIVTSLFGFAIKKGIDGNPAPEPISSIFKLLKLLLIEFCKSNIDS